jgi:hypothetical protein
MHSKIFKNFLYKYLFILLLIKLFQSNSFPQLKFPFSIILSNDNIFIIHQDGVSIYNSGLSNLISDEIIFNDSEKINSEYSLSKITVSQFDNGYIIALINDKIYFFDYKGSLIYKSTEQINDNNNGLYYTLVPIKFFNDYYYYLIGFINNGALYFFYYKFHKKSKENILIKSYKPMKKSDGTELCNILNSGLSCQLMSYNFNDKYLSCFFVCDNSPKRISIYDFSLDEIEIISMTNSVINVNLENIICIKSVTNVGGSKSFVCFYLEEKTCYCFKYDTNDIINGGSTITLKKIFKNNCNTNFYSMKIGYISGKEEFTTSCIGIDGGLHVKVYNDNMNLTNKIDKYTNCSNIYGYSIFYSFIADEYYVLSDVECNGTRFPYNFLTKEKEIEDNNEEIFPTTIITNNFNNEYYNNICRSNNKDNVIICLRNQLINGELDLFILNNIIKEKKDLIIEENNIIYQLTSSYNQNNNEYNNLSSINLDICEKK